jgi:hypothetical protein
MFCKQLPLALGLVLLSVLLGAGCERAPTAPAIAAPDGAYWSLGGGPGSVTVPFSARFFTVLAGVMPDESCGSEPGVFLNIQEGTGEGTHLGRFSVRITFCMDVTNFPTVPYWNGVGTFTGANGDQLFITIEGTVLPSDHPDFDLEFSDPFDFVGGTGRFSGASGGGITNSFVDLQVSPSRTQHEWTGTLTRPRGK